MKPLIRTGAAMVFLVGCGNVHPSSRSSEGTGPAKVADPAAGAKLQLDYATAKLPNGLRLIAIRDDSTDLVEIDVRYQVGARRRVWPADATGHAARLVLVKMLSAAAASLRDRRGASYGIQAMLDERNALDRYVVEGAVDALRAGEALVALRSAIALLLSDDGFEDAFLKARRQLVRGLVAESRSLDEIADQLVDQASGGRPADHFDRLLVALQEMKPATVRVLARQDLRADREIIVLLGEQSALQAAYAATGIRDYDLRLEQLTDSR